LQSYQNPLANTTTESATALGVPQASSV